MKLHSCSILIQPIQTYVSTVWQNTRQVFSIAAYTTYWLVSPVIVHSTMGADDLCVDWPLFDLSNVLARAVNASWAGLFGGIACTKVTWVIMQRLTLEPNQIKPRHCGIYLDRGSHRPVLLACPPNYVLFIRRCLLVVKVSFPVCRYRGFVYFPYTRNINIYGSTTNKPGTTSLLAFKYMHS